MNPVIKPHIEGLFQDNLYRHLPVLAFSRIVWQRLSQDTKYGTMNAVVPVVRMARGVNDPGLWCLSKDISPEATTGKVKARTVSFQKLAPAFVAAEGSVMNTFRNSRVFGYFLIVKHRPEAQLT